MATILAATMPEMVDQQLAVITGVITQAMTPTAMELAIRRMTLRAVSALKIFIHLRTKMVG